MFEAILLLCYLFPSPAKPCAWSTYCLLIVISKAELCMCLASASLRVMYFSLVGHLPSCLSWIIPLVHHKRPKMYEPLTMQSCCWICSEGMGSTTQFNLEECRDLVPVKYMGVRRIEAKALIPFDHLTDLFKNCCGKVKLLKMLPLPNLPVLYFVTWTPGSSHSPLDFFVHAEFLYPFVALVTALFPA